MFVGSAQIILTYIQFSFHTIPSFYLIIFSANKCLWVGQANIYADKNERLRGRGKKRKERESK